VSTRETPFRRSVAHLPPRDQRRCMISKPPRGVVRRGRFCRKGPGLDKGDVMRFGDSWNETTNTICENIWPISSRVGSNLDDAGSVQPPVPLFLPRTWGCDSVRDISAEDAEPRRSLPPFRRKGGMERFKNTELICIIACLGGLERGRLRPR
jgi:hypothetical protein